MGTDYVISNDRFKNFFNQLETRKSVLTTITQLHKTLTDHFVSLEQSLSEKSQTLDSQIDTFDEKTKKALESLENRENAIPERESTAAGRIEEQKEAAIADIEKAEEGGGGERSLSEMLRMYCRRMDSKGLDRFLLGRRKESAVLRAEIAAAAEEAVDAAGMVVEVVEKFVEMKVEGKSGMADRRWAVGMVIQAAVPVVEGGGVVVAGSVRERAAAAVEKWKGVMGGGGGEDGGSGVGAGEATMFLQMVVGYGLKERFEEEYLRKLVVEFATRRDMAKLAMALGLGDKMKDIIDDLVNSGKEIEAVYFAYESGLTEQFPPVPLLRTCLKDCRRNVNNISKKGNLEEANNLELNATKTIIKCVEDHKLESQFTLEGLKKRVTQLEKAKAEKRKGAIPTSKPSNKRAHRGGDRGSGGGPPSYRPPKAGRFSNASPSFRQRNPSQSHQAAAARYSAPYNYHSHTMYEGPATASYGPGYGGAHTRSPAALPQQYSLAPQDMGPTGTRAAGSYGGQVSCGGQTNYGVYDYSAAAGPAYPPYPQ
ncbi:FRIGIDA-like protein 4a [Actinidia eriantha]|uniref:FRIGIDA-like protein 4a n=1 Tax=Actinidia eriantha TaxID=165200 RepID=UPI0025855641|nr:FRIGIDA-like protein 4a [Actinidia eriantha]